MPNPPYEVLNLTYAGSSKSKPWAATGTKRRQATDNPRGSDAKKAHLEWLHFRAIPDMDREIMKTNVLVDNILAEQTELDTQMLAIKALGGDEAYRCAYKAHDGLRRAIAKRLLDTKNKRAKQFESIRSMRTMLRTLVAEIDENDDNRQSILKPRPAPAGTTYTIIIKFEGNHYLSTLFNTLFHSGPNPRSLLRPEINRDNTLGAGASAPPPSYYPTPPATPIRGRCVWLPPQVQSGYNHWMLYTSRSPTTSNEREASPVFSDDDGNGFELGAILSPIPSPPSSTSSPHRSATSIGYKHKRFTTKSRKFAHRKRKCSCLGGSASFSSTGLTYPTNWYKRRSNDLPCNSSKSLVTVTTSLPARPILKLCRLYFSVRLLHSLIARYDSYRIISNFNIMEETKTNYEIDTNCRLSEHLPSTGDDA